MINFFSNNIFSSNPTWSIGIIIVLFGIVATHRLLIYRDKKNIFNNAAKEFSEIIYHELCEIYPIPVNWPENIEGYLGNKFPVLQSAVNNFARYLTEIEKTEFLNAWAIYRVGEDGSEIDQQDYWQYTPHRSTSIVYGEKTEYDNTKTYKENFKHNVDNILKYAKQT